MEDRSVPTVFFVTNTADGGFGSLRQAILNANNNGNPGVVDTIQFDIRLAGLPGGFQRIDIVSQPFTSTQLTITEPVIIDGTTQPGITGSTGIELNGRNAGNVSGLVISSPNCTVRGLRINGFAASGIEIRGTGATGNVIEGNLIGTGGTVTNGNGLSGVVIDNAPGNRIGGTATVARNVLSNNGNYGVYVVGTGAVGNRIEGNYIGTDTSGTSRSRNQFGGVLINQAPGTVIGGTAVGARNVISGNDGYGVWLLNAGATGNQVLGNYIGTDAGGATELGNSNVGVFVQSAAHNTIGGAAVGARNVISGNRGGVVIVGGGAANNIVQGNYVGTDATGTRDLDSANTFNGISVVDSTDYSTIPGSPVNNTIAGNLVSGNFVGIRIGGAGTSGNQVLGNYIGTDVTGTKKIGNGNVGIFIDGAPNNTVGGASQGAGNLVSGNESFGIAIGVNSGKTTDGTKAVGNRILGNAIGADVTRTRPLGNSLGGVAVSDRASNNIVGTPATGEGNIIAFNLGSGVFVSTAGTVGNRIRGNILFANDGLGIDLSAVRFPGDGLTPNDPGDADDGPNRFQNFPELAEAHGTPTTTRVVGSLNGTAGTTFTLDFYASTAADPSGYGEGQRFLGSAAVVTDGAGDAKFDVTLQSAVGVGGYVTATATDPAGNTSEFSVARLVTSPAVGLLPDALRVNDGAAQRSIVTSLTVTCAGHVELPANPAVAFRLTRAGGGETTLAVAAADDALGRTVATITFMGGGNVYQRADGGYALIDGNYTLTVLGDQIRDGSGQLLDGDGDGLAGGDFRAVFHRLFGDSDGDRDVDMTDALRYRTAFIGGPAVYAPFDYNGNGIIDGLDATQLFLRFGTYLPPV